MRRLKSLEDIDGPEERKETIIELLRDGENSYTTDQLSQQLEVSKSTILRDMEDISEGYPLQKQKGKNGANLYSMEDISYLSNSEFNPSSGSDLEDIGKYLEGEVSGRHKDINNYKKKDKKRTKMLVINEPGWGTKYFDEDVIDGLAYKLEELKEEEGEEYFEEDFMVVVNGSALPRIPFWSYKTAQQYQQILGEAKDAEDGSVDREFLKEFLDDEVPEEEVDQRVSELEKKLDTRMDLESNQKKLSDLGEASDLVNSYIDKIYDSIGDQADLYVHLGEQDQKNIEDLKELKIQELTDDRKDKIKELKKTIDGRNEVLENFMDEIERKRAEYIDEIEEIEHQLNGEADPTDLDLEEFDIAEEEFETYEEVLEAQETLEKEIKKAQHSMNALKIEEALGSLANIVNRKYLEPKETEIAQALAELEYDEYIHELGNVKGIGREPEVMRVEKGGHSIDIAHNLNLASDEPLIHGFKREIDRYRNRTDHDADLVITGHHGLMHAMPYRWGRSDEEKNTTWFYQAPVLHDKKLIEEMGEEKGFNLLKDVKRKNKGLFSSAATIVEMDVFEGDDGKLREKFSIQGWDQEMLKNLGKQIKGKKNFLGTDFTEKAVKKHIIARGDDQIGSPNLIKHLNEPLVEEVIKDDFSNIHRYLEQEGVEPENLLMVEGGDAFQGNDIYDGQKTEGGMLQGKDELKLKEAVINTMEGRNVEFESFGDYVNYTEPVSEDTMKALKYIEHRNKKQQPLTDLGDQGKLVQEYLVDRYEEIVQKGSDMVIVDGNHYNNNHEGMDEAKRIREMLDEGEGNVMTASGLTDGDGTFNLDELKARIKHRPTGRGSNTRDKQISQEIEPDTDVVVNADKHWPGFSMKDSTLYIMPGSSQSTNNFSKTLGIAPPEKGSVYLSRSEEPEKNEFKFSYYSVKGLNPLSEKS